MLFMSRFCCVTQMFLRFILFCLSLTNPLIRLRPSVWDDFCHLRRFIFSCSAFRSFRFIEFVHFLRCIFLILEPKDRQVVECLRFGFIFCKWLYQNSHLRWQIAWKGTLLNANFDFLRTFFTAAIYLVLGISASSLLYGVAQRSFAFLKSFSFHCCLAEVEVY